jgi:hypothetical protein
MDDSSFILVRCLPIERNSVNLVSVFIYGFVYSGFECDGLKMICFHGTYYFLHPVRPVPYFSVPTPLH